MQENIQSFEIKRYIAIILRRKYIALSTGLAVLSLFTWFSFLMPKTYESTSTIAIEGGSVLNPLIQGVGVTMGNEGRIGNLKNQITSRSFIEKVIKKLNINAHIMDSVHYEVFLGNLRNNLDVIIRGDRPNLLSISYKGRDPQKVADLVNAISTVYIDENMHSRRTDISEAYEFIKSQLLEYKNKLEESDRAIREFKERNPNTVPQSEATLLSRLESQRSSELDAEIRLKELMRKRDNLQKQLSGEKELTIALVTREGSSQTRLNNLNNQLMLLMAKYTENYPEVIRIKNEIEELKKQITQSKGSHIESSSSETSALNPIYQQLKEELARTDAEIASVRGRMAALSMLQQDTQRRFGRIPKEQEEWTKLQRDRNVYQQMYDQLLQKLETARVSEEIELAEKGGTLRIVEPARVPSFPIKPNRVKMILMGIFFGLASGLGAVFGLEYFDHSLKDEDAIEANLKLPVLATIPKIVTEADELAAKRFDRKIFMASGAYLFIIGLVFVGEFISRYMGIKIINF
ncbi:MAG: XrtA system polysaccharide chain length determinant [Nitrospirota bacterium]